MDGDPQAPGLGVSACVWRGDRFLVVERGKSPARGLWSLPGGHVQLGETVRQAAARELHEETGVTARLDTLIDVLDAIRHDASGHVTRHYAIVVYGGPWQEGEPVAADDAARAEWLTVDEVRTRPTTQGLVEVLERAAALVTAN